VFARKGVTIRNFAGAPAVGSDESNMRLYVVDPRNTSQKCSGCGERVQKSLAVRTHACPSCGLAIDRDYNASLNILRAGMGAGALNVIGCR